MDEPCQGPAIRSMSRTGAAGADWGGRGYLKRPFCSIGSEETLIGPARPDPHPHRPRASRAVALIGIAGAIDVNPCVHATTGETDAQETPPSGGGSGYVLRVWITRNVHISSSHISHFLQVAELAGVRVPHVAQRWYRARWQSELSRGRPVRPPVRGDSAILRTFVA